MMKKNVNFAASKKKRNPHAVFEGINLIQTIMDYIPLEKNLSFLPKEKFVDFYNEATEIILEATDKKNRNKEKNVSLQDLMDEYGIIVRTNTLVDKRLSPAFSANMYEPNAVALKACPVCSVCSLCVLCGELNYGTGAATLTGLLSAFDK